MLSKYLIPLLNITTQQVYIILTQLIKMVCYLLTICLDCKICLPKCNYFLSLVTILHNQIASISEQCIILYKLVCCSCFHDFADLSKIMENITPTVPHAIMALFITPVKFLTGYNLKQSQVPSHSKILNRPHKFV